MRYSTCSLQVALVKSALRVSQGDEGKLKDRGSRGPEFKTQDFPAAEFPAIEWPHHSNDFIRPRLPHLSENQHSGCCLGVQSLFKTT
jgi:hypothetical protein